MSRISSKDSADPYKTELSEQSQQTSLPKDPDAHKGLRWPCCLFRILSGDRVAIQWVPDSKLQTEVEGSNYTY